MKYRNSKTGAVIDTACKIAGGNWVPVAATKKAAVPVSASKKSASKRSTKK